MHRRILLIITFLFMVNIAAAQDATAEPMPLPEGVPDPAGYEWALVADGFDSPIGIVPANDGTSRMFAWEQNGKMWVINGEEVSFEPFLDIGDLIPPSVFQGGYSEQGLLGVAFHPQYAENGYFYIHYSDVNGDTTIARYKVSSDPEVADPASGTILLSVDQPYPDHNGGQLAFGPDGYLYIGLGDGGNPDDPLRNGQNLNTLLGKLLRIDVNATPYKVPADNPFVGRSDAKPEIWAYGLRNPFRFSFDRETGDLFIGDVGQWDYEEVDFAPAGVGGQNYGWSAYQGMHEYIKQTKPIDDSRLTLPILEYTHVYGCSITGGYIYRGEALPDMNGVYIYGDYCNGRMWAAVKNGDVWQGGVWMETGLTITSFGEDESGELYLIDYKGGIYKLVAAQS
ncbi:MAG: PQQ-dependent sugar dehydrogenase [Chloroflexi bacterium]|nr:PQQ-dependent sugar dehydrogenase [Chloroflexota bacterium]MCC6894162.1 PQQ-dependent sugar dehydrogenase [Anaerolineae bacterium]